MPWAAWRLCGESDAALLACLPGTGEALGAVVVGRKTCGMKLWGRLGAHDVQITSAGAKDGPDKAAQQRDDGIWHFCLWQDTYN